MKAASRIILTLGIIAGVSATTIQAKTTLDELPLINLDNIFQSRGNHSYDVWNDMSKSANPAGGSYPGSTMWPAYEAQISSKGAGQGAYLRKLSNAADGGGPYFASGSVYFGGGSSTTNGGDLAVTEYNPLSGLKTLTLQLETGEAEGRDLYSLPVLTITMGGGTEVVIDFIYGGVIDQVVSDTFTPPGSDLGPQDLYTNLWGFQWDVSNYTNISEISISFSGVGHSRVYGLQLDQSDYAFGNESIFDYMVPVPEPTTWALILGTVVMGGAVLRRRRAA